MTPETATVVALSAFNRRVPGETGVARVSVGEYATLDSATAAQLVARGVAAPVDDADRALAEVAASRALYDKELAIARTHRLGWAKQADEDRQRGVKREDTTPGMGKRGIRT